MQILKIAQCPCKMTDTLIRSGKLRQERLQVKTFPEWPFEVLLGTSQVTSHSLSLHSPFKVQLALFWDIHHSTLSKQIFGAALGMTTQKTPVFKNLTKIMLDF